MRAFAHRGDPERPLLIAFHGFTQYVCGWLSWPPFRRNFLILSGLLESCRHREWNLWAPQAPLSNWRSNMAQRSEEWLQRARRDCNASQSKCFVCGFSDGAMMAHLFAEACNPAGLWAYSGFFPDSILIEGSYRVCISYDEGDLQRITAESKIALDRYREARLPTLEEVGGKDGHRWDPALNELVFDWLDLP